MSAKAFVDTNVLIYAHDVDATAKHRIAKHILQDLWNQRTGVLSTQVLQEFYVNVTRKIASPLPKESARAVVGSYLIWCVDITSQEISAAFRVLGCVNCGRSAEDRSRPNSIGRFEPWANDLRYADRKSIYQKLVDSVMLHESRDIPPLRCVLHASIVTRSQLFEFLVVGRLYELSCATEPKSDS